MDDNELENEREKREHELDLAKLQNPRSGWDSFWEMVSDNIFWIFLIIGGIVAAYVKIRTGHDFKFDF